MKVIQRLRRPGSITNVPSQSRPVPSFSPTGGKPNPQFPGQKSGMNMRQVQQFIDDAIKVQGDVVSIDTGVTDIEVNISGTAKFMYGFAVHAKDNFNDETATPTTVTLMVNNEALIQDMPFDMLDIKYNTHEYFKFPRPLAGNDQVVLSITNDQAAQNICYAFYYQ